MQYRRAHANGTVIAATVAATLLAAAPAAAEEIYRQVNEDGVPSFSDVAAPGAERLDLTVPPPAEGGVTYAREMIEQQLAVAKSLEESRLAREKAQAELAQARAAERSRTVVYYPVERPVYGGGYFGGYRWPGGGPRPPKPVQRPSDPDYESRVFHPFRPLMPTRPPAAARPPAHRGGGHSRASGTDG